MDKPRWFFWVKKAVEWVAYFYLGLISCYFILRFIWWDSFWVVGAIAIFIPWLLFPLFLLPIIAFFIIKKRWLTIISSIICLLLIGWLHLKYFSPHPVAISQPSIKVLSLNCSWYKTSSENLTKLIQTEQPDIVFLQELVKKHTQRALVWLKSAYPYQFTAPEIGIISKYPIQFSEVLHLAGHRDIQQLAIIKVSDRDIVIYNISVKSPWIN